MKNLSSLASLALASVLVFAPAGAEAITYDIGANAGVSVSASTSSHSGTGVGSVSGSVGSTATGSDSDDGAALTNSTVLDINSQAGVGGSATPIAIDRADVDGKAAVSATINVPEAVRTQADLNAYAATAVRADKNIDGVVLSDSGVMLRYMQPGKLFGFVPVTVTVTTEVDSQGHVSVKYPWYRFLVTVSDKEELEAAIQARVDAALKTYAETAASTAVTASGNSESALTSNTLATTTVMLDAKMKAQLLAEVRDAMKSTIEANTDLSAAASLR